MIGFAAALLLTAAPAQPPGTWGGQLCRQDAASKTLVQSRIYYSRDASKVWLIGQTALTPIDPKTLAKAGGKPFFINNEVVKLNGVSWTKYGLPRVLAANELDPKPFGIKDGAPFYKEPGLSNPEVIYALSEAVGCEFQPYQRVY